MGLFSAPEQPAPPPPPPPAPLPATFADPSVAKAGENARKRTANALGQEATRTGSATKPQTAAPGLGGAPAMPTMM